MSEKKQGQRPIVPQPPATPTMAEPGPPPVQAQPAGYEMTFRFSPDDSQIIAYAAHRFGCTPVDLVGRAVQELVMGIRAQIAAGVQA